MGMGVGVRQCTVLLQFFQVLSNAIRMIASMWSLDCEHALRASVVDKSKKWAIC